MSFKTKMEDQLNRCFEAMEKSEIGSDEYKAAMDSATRLMGSEIEFEKINCDAQTQAKAQEIDKALRAEQQRDDRVDKIIRNTFMIVNGILTLGTIWLLSAASFAHEETGSTNTIIGKKVLGMLVPKM